MTKAHPSTPTAHDASALLRQADNLRKQAQQLEIQAMGLEGGSAAKQAAREIQSRKGKVAVFLGAGASKTFGWPLTNELLPIILGGLIDKDLFEDVRINKKRGKNAADRKLLKKALLALCPGIILNQKFLKECKHRLPLVTSLLSMLDFSLMSGHAIVSGLTPEELTDARILLERAIYEAIAHEEEEESPHYWPPRRSNELAPQLTQWLDRTRRDQTQVAVITSNYDVAVEQAWGFKRSSMLHISSLGVDFGFDWTWPSSVKLKVLTRPARPKRRLYKLHGSTNWLRCGLCDRMYIDPSLVDIAIFAYDREIRERNMCHCQHAKLEVQIVSPSFVREVQSPNLISVWQRALNWFRQSEDWIVIGYSFPDEDLNIRSLFTRALASAERPPHITAIQFGVNEQTRTRYEAFFPMEQLTFLTCGLEAFLQTTNIA